MIKKLSIILFVLGTVSLQITQVQAALISFDPSNQSVELGDSVSVDLRISDLGTDIVSTFDLDIGYDDAILDFQSFTFGSGLDTFGFGTNINGAADLGGGIVNIFELSFDFDSDLLAYQPNDFVLGTFNFDTLSLGTSSLDITVVALGGEFADPLAANLQSGSIEVTAASAVPAPATTWLLGIGLIGLMGFSKRNQVFPGP